MSFHFLGTFFMLVALSLLRFHMDFVLVFAGTYALLTLPLAYLHVQYYLANRRLEVIIENGELTITEKNGHTEKLKFTEISKVILYKSASLDKEAIQFTPLESYHYARIITKSEKQILVTCLMSPKLEEIVNGFVGVMIVRKKRFFCTLSFE